MNFETKLDAPIVNVEIEAGGNVDTGSSHSNDVHCCKVLFFTLLVLSIISLIIGVVLICGVYLVIFPTLLSWVLAGPLGIGLPLILIGCTIVVFFAYSKRLKSVKVSYASEIEA